MRTFRGNINEAIEKELKERRLITLKKERKHITNKKQ